MSTVTAIRRHPLTTNRKPGPIGDEDIPPPDAWLNDADKVLKLVDRGELSADSSQYPPISVPADRNGKPKKPLTAAQEKELATRIQEWGCVESRHMFVLANMGLVYMVANEFRHTGVDIEDIVQEGVVGIIRATETFEPGRNIRFSTYCVHWIRAKMQRLIQRLNRDDSPLMAAVAMEEDANKRRRRPRSRVTSLQEPLGGLEIHGTHGDLVTLEEILPSDTEAQEEMSIRGERRDLLLKILDEVREALGDQRIDLVIRHRLLADEPESLRVLGERMNLSREGVRLLEIKVLRLARTKLLAEMDLH
jgi:RNA polymerase sigma factor (sigma-70 family)